MANLLQLERDAHLEESNRTVASVEDFVRRFGGNQVIYKVLVHHKGPTALHVMSSIQQWAYELFGNKNAIKLVVMVTPQDLEANAEYIDLADNYLPVLSDPDIQLVLNIAKNEKVQAVWAGVKMPAAKCALLTELLTLNGIDSIGPPENSIYIHRDRIASLLVAQTAEIKTLFWSGTGLKADTSGKELKISAKSYLEACVTDVDAGLLIAQTIGFPVIIKATSEGECIQGFRKVVSIDDFPAQFIEVQKVYPRSSIFIQKMAVCARLIKIQYLADTHGNAITLFGRDCSFQKEYKALIEEAPCLNSEVFDEMKDATIRIVKLSRLVGTGTVEFLHEENRKFYFLKINTTYELHSFSNEIVSDINLPACLLQIAMGIPLNSIGCIRRFYGENPWNFMPIQFKALDKKPHPRGHCIVALLTSCNPDFLNLKELIFSESKCVMGYGGSENGEYQFGPCFSYGSTREEAIQNLISTLEEGCDESDMHLLSDYITTLLKQPVFLKNEYHTTWIDEVLSREINPNAEAPAYSSDGLNAKTPVPARRSLLGRAPTIASNQSHPGDVPSGEFALRGNIPSENKDVPTVKVRPRLGPVRASTVEARSLQSKKTSQSPRNNQKAVEQSKLIIKGTKWDVVPRYVKEDDSLVLNNSKGVVIQYENSIKYVYINACSDCTIQITGDILCKVDINHCKRIQIENVGKTPKVFCRNSKDVKVKSVSSFDCSGLEKEISRISDSATNPMPPSIVNHFSEGVHHHYSACACGGACAGHDKQDPTAEQKRH